VGTAWVQQKAGMKTTVSLAYLNERNDARYVFFMDPAAGDAAPVMPNLHADDILLLGSFYAVNPRNRQRVEQLLALPVKEGPSSIMMSTCARPMPTCCLGCCRLSSR
jgi:hypothetical protein